MANLLDKDIVQYNDMVAHLRTGQPFNMTYVEADRRRGTGGELRTLKGWVMHQPASVEEELKVKQNRKSRIAKALYECNPMHSIHKTSNVTNLKSKAILKIHIKLIIEYNGKTVVL